MDFHYSQYYKVLTIGSLFYIAFFMLAILISTIKFLTSYIKHSPDLNFGNYVCSQIVTIFIALIIAFPSFKHGVYLFSEKENQAIADVGTITDITRTYGNNKYSYGDVKNVFASYVYIDDEKYYIMYIGDFNIGDEVEFEYLPKSKIILSIYHTEEAP